MSVIKKRFVEQILKDEAARYKKNQGLAMRKLLTFHSNNVIASRVFTVNKSDELDGQLNMQHSIVQRFLDMKKKGGKRKKSYPIHNKFAFGHYYSIANRLMSDFTEEVRSQIVKEFGNG
ncbi:MAG: hypothetical protein RIC03_12610 [Cyclobacteriaceae bacterium]